MASIVIVTKQCYLICEAINYIAINENENDSADDYKIYPIGSRKKRLTKKQKQAQLAKQFQIVIDFIPTHGVNRNSLRGSNGSSSESASVVITVTGKERCLELFSDMVAQIREQMPDQMFLDKLVEKLLTSTESNPKS